MKSLLRATVAATVIAAAGSAGAADVRMPVKGPPVAVAPAASTWNGCFVGGHAGLAAGHTNWRDTAPNGAIDATLTGQTASTEISGSIYGGQLGCDYQMSGNFVVGLEGSYSGSAISGTNMDQFNPTWTLRSQTSSITTATGRLGFALNSALIYGRGGVAWAKNKFEIENTGILDGRPSVTRQGMVFGGGIEWSFAPSWTVFLEGDYFTFGKSNVAFAGDTLNPTAPFTVQSKQNFEALKFGVNYRTNGLGLLGM